MKSFHCPLLGDPLRSCSTDFRDIDKAKRTDLIFGPIISNLRAA